MGLIELFRKKEKQITPELFCGVNVGRIPRERNNLFLWCFVPHIPPEPAHFLPSIRLVTGNYTYFNKEYIIHDYGLDSLLESTSKEGLKVFIDKDGGRVKKHGSYFNANAIYIGQRMNEKYSYGYSIGRITQESLDTKEVTKQNSSELIARLKRVGLDVKPEELGFYGVVALD